MQPSCSALQTTVQEHCLDPCPCSADELADQADADAERAEVRQQQIDSGEVQQEVEGDKAEDSLPGPEDEGPEDEADEGASPEDIEAIDPEALVDPEVEEE